MSKKIAIHWFRQDLRLADNPALYQASQADETITIFILDKNQDIGSASKLWLHHSLNSLNSSLDNKLNFYSGNPLEIIKKIIKENNITDFYWNRCYDKYSIDRDTQIKQFLQQHKINVNSFNGSLLIEPWQCKKDDGTHYKVYTPFYKELIKIRKYRSNIAKPNFSYLRKLNNSENLDSLKLLEPKHSWQNIIKQWQIGESASHQILEEFLNNKVKEYKTARDFMSTDSTSKLSPYLHFGEISPSQIFNAVQSLDYIGNNEEHFIKELVWRDFSYYQIYYYPELHNKNINQKFDSFKWDNDPTLLKKWQKGQTGIPIVDAGMRELWQTGYMHNRVRMIVASFLIKNCLIHWKYGEKWFFDTLFDADFASNNANWQWVAGCGLDAAPYFRIFNPVLQAEKFEAYEYIRKYVPELKLLPNKLIAKPWEASELVLQEAGITLGQNYPKPIVDLKKSRDRALQLHNQIK
ncbi:deoxyribodipyrimidine photo-lyase [Francisella tularensis subsp. novicida]|uniref:Deoxyribodipyrimidine photo-lyase n=2 Tax=Francisella tularensis TaxID=263 RepID=A0A6I4RUB6_FRATU|nr:deoxyribodipyrimidine photo-lyase [Francisella tularensis]ABK90007.1 deoxyribodipyrimidine photolyase [Francisella tularensis subsp. novicida U112]AJI61224.1 FAD binding domain of DNA photolyase family protein [Francisella tularensis subsp. novicida U112]APA83286.1 Deoxyribodipyrimidine photolyase [Francisella tularensis subsp. novicida PA10-7858]EDX19529.1 deoxyribodipyrimidine photolyase family protein [Francisella tularensis subsp. novicida FTE]EDZ90531.1 deoxyribodipyrimidine photolyase